MASIGPVSMSTGSTPTRQVSTIRARARRPSASARSAVMSSTAAAPSEICDDEPAVWTPSGRATGLSSASFSRLVSRRPSSRATGCVVPVGLPSSSTSGASTGTIWLPKRSSAQAGGGVLLRAEAELVGVGPGDAPLLGDALGALELRGELVLREVRLRDRDAEAEVLAAAGADRHPAHDLDAAGEGGVDRAAADERGGQVGGLLRRAALRVDRGGGHRQGQAGGQPRGAGDVEGLLADLADAAADDLADLRPGRCPSARRRPSGRRPAGRRGGWWTGRRCACPTGVRTASTITTSDMASNLSAAQRRRPLAASSTRSRAAAPMKATNTEPRSSSSKVVDLVARGESRDRAGQERPEHPDDDRAQAASLGRADGPAGQTAREEPHDAPARGSPCGRDATRASGGARRRSGGGTGARGAAFAPSASCSAARAAWRDARASAMPRRPTSRVASSIRQAGGVSRRVSCRAMPTSQPRGCDSHTRAGRDTRHTGR